MKIITHSRQVNGTERLDGRSHLIDQEGSQRTDQSGFSTPTCIPAGEGQRRVTHRDGTWVVRQTQVDSLLNIIPVQPSHCSWAPPQ